MPSKKFQKTVEDFVCEHCGTQVVGNGYTNHCPNCLWSKHADINPGDRKADCEGMMEPVGVESKGNEFTIIHRCQKCGAQKKNKVCAEDDFKQVIKIGK